MRNRLLYTTLRDFTEQAGYQLAADATEGAEVPFELVESRGSRSSLYAYRPLTEEFIRTRLDVLVRLPGYGPAVRALEVLDGVVAYLAVRGEEQPPTSSHQRADAALRFFLAVVFEETTDFELSTRALRARLRRARDRRSTRGARSSPCSCRSRGSRSSATRSPIGDGLTLARSDAIVDPPDDLTSEGDDAVAVADHRARAPRHAAARGRAQARARAAHGAAAVRPRRLRRRRRRLGPTRRRPLAHARAVARAGAAVGRDAGARARRRGRAARVREPGPAPPAAPRRGGLGAAPLRARVRAPPAPGGAERLPARRRARCSSPRARPRAGSPAAWP